MRTRFAGLTLGASFADGAMLSLWAALALRACGSDLALRTHRPRLAALTGSARLATLTLGTGGADFAALALRTTLTRRAVPQLRQLGLDLAAQLRL